MSTPENPRGPQAPPVGQSQMPPGGWDQPLAAPPPMAPYASWGSRVVAAIVDFVLISVPPAVVGLGIFDVTPGESDDFKILAFILAVFVYLLLFAATAILYAPLLMRRPGERNGQTWGKQLMGIRVARPDGAPLGYGTAVLREWVAKTVVFWGAGFAIAGGLATLLDYLWPLWDDRNEALHDKIATTVVIDA